MGISRNPVGGADRPQSSGLSRSQWKMILIASLGGSLEFYDFIVYGFSPITSRPSFSRTRRRWSACWLLSPCSRSGT